MTSKTKIITGVVLSTVLATGLFAKHHGENKGYCEGKKSHKMMKKHGKHGGMHMMKMFKKLDLTSAQKDKIKAIMKENRKSKMTMSDAFTKDSFDKAKFTQIMNEKRDNMVKSKADTIEKVYAVLDAKQKEKLKTMMDTRKEKMLSH